MQKTPLKIGLDVHGVIDTFPKEFRKLSQALVLAGHEIHIVTGLQYDLYIREELEKAGISYTHYFSIVDQLLEEGIPIEWKNGLPWAPDEPWNSAKRKYCDREGIHLMIDDSEVYRETFHDSDTVYLHLINRERKSTKQKRRFLKK